MHDKKGMNEIFQLPIVNFAKLAILGPRISVLFTFLLFKTLSCSMTNKYMKYLQ